jgi:hypothetical protein
MLPKPCRRGSTRSHRRCACAGKRSSIRCHTENADGRDALLKRWNNVATEMALNVLGYNLTHVMSNVGVKPLVAAMRA